jgi:hypothetical protein
MPGVVPSSSSHFPRVPGSKRLRVDSFSTSSLEREGSYLESSESFKLQYVPREQKARRHFHGVAPVARTLSLIVRQREHHKSVDSRENREL